MQTKLTLRLEESLIRKAKRVARKRGKSVSQVVGEYFSELDDAPELDALPPITASMVGILKGQENAISEEDYKRYLEEKHR